MIEKLHWTTTGEGRGLSADIARDEPSHIHLPRRRRTARPSNGGISAAVSTHIGDGAFEGQAPLAAEEA